MRGDDGRWRLTAARVGPAEGDAVLALYRDTPRHRAASWLWCGAWAGTGWRAVEVSTATLAAVLAATASPTPPSAAAAAALSALLVVLVSRWSRACVAVWMPHWASDGMMSIHRERATTDRGDGGALTPQTWAALCQSVLPQAAPDKPITWPRSVARRPDLPDAVHQWATARAAAGRSGGDVRRRAALVEGLVA